MKSEFFFGYDDENFYEHNREGIEVASAKRDLLVKKLEKDEKSFVLWKGVIRTSEGHPRRSKYLAVTVDGYYVSK